MELLKKMLEVETRALELIEKAQAEANEIRKKAHDDAQQLIVDGRKNMHERVQQEIARLEHEAHVRKDEIHQDAEQHLVTMRQHAEAQMEFAVEHVVQTLLSSMKEPEQRV